MVKKFGRGVFAFGPVESLCSSTGIDEGRIAPTKQWARGATNERKVLEFVGVQAVYVDS